MRIHHLDCGNFTPPGGRLLGASASEGGVARLACHCLLVELPDRLLLVDAGVGLNDVRDPLRRIGARMLALTRPQLEPMRTALRQVHSLGFRGEDVREILVTHMDFDHIGGLSDFPHARVHVAHAELQAALRPSRVERQRFRPLQWAHGPDWAAHGAGGERWLGFEEVRPLADLGPDLLRVPLPGHTRGHCGYAIRSEHGWLLHAGDAILDRRELGFWRHPPVALRAYQRSLAVDVRARKRSRAALAHCHQEHGHEVEILCTHDAAGLEERRG
jgi:glyoxylase-like metal-dependent hydrolase (beta-lactamase superfamily II)